MSYTVNALNQYTAVGTVTPTYDASGNLISADTFDPVPTATAGTTSYVTDPDKRLVLEYNGSTGAILRWYAYGLGPNEVLNRMDVPSGTRQTLIPDIQGSMVAALDSGSGTLSKRGYLPYGESTTSTGSFAYTGQYLDSSGLYNYRARIYSPALGRFLQPDPIGYAGGRNLYAYVGNDPLNRSDPSGELDVVYRPGSTMGSLKNWGSPGLNFFVADEHGATYPMGAGVFQRTVVEGRPFDQVFGPTQTSRIIDWGRTYIQNTRLSGSTGNATLPEVIWQSGEGRPWDTKQFLPFTSAYVLNEKAELRDYVGNAIWGTALNSLGISETTARLGAHGQAFLQNAASGFKKGIFDDPRDQEAISFGYTLSLPSSSGPGSGGSTSPGKPGK